MYHVDIHFVGWSGRLRRVLKNIVPHCLPIGAYSDINSTIRLETFGFGGFVAGARLREDTE